MSVTAAIAPSGDRVVVGINSPAPHASTLVVALEWKEALDFASRVKAYGKALRDKQKPLVAETYDTGHAVYVHFECPSSMTPDEALKTADDLRAMAERAKTARDRGDKQRAEALAVQLEIMSAEEEAMKP